MPTPTITSPAANLIFVPYSYTVFGVIAASGSVTVPLQLDPDADFELHLITGRSSLDDATDFRPNYFTVQIADRGNSRFWSNANISQVELTAPSAGGLVVRRPVVLAAKTNLSFQFQNLVAEEVTAYLTLVGAKVIR